MVGWPVGVGHDDGDLVVGTNRQRAVLVLVVREVEMELRKLSRWLDSSSSGT